MHYHSTRANNIAIHYVHYPLTRMLYHTICMAMQNLETKMDPTLIVVCKYSVFEWHVK